MNVRWSCTMAMTLEEKSACGRGRARCSRTANATMDHTTDMTSRTALILSGYYAQVQVCGLHGLVTFGSRARKEFSTACNGGFDDWTESHHVLYRFHLHFHRSFVVFSPSIRPSQPRAFRCKPVPSDAGLLQGEGRPARQLQLRRLRVSSMWGLRLRPLWRRRVLHR